MPIDPRTTIGHVHLKVSDLDRAIAFYRDAIGFELKGRIGDQLAFLAAGDYHHHIALNTLESRGGHAPRPEDTGLFHVAIRLPTRAALAESLLRLREHDVPLTGAKDHGANESLYLRDPDGNGVELTWDRPVDEWPRTPDGSLALINDELDPDSLLA